MLLRLASATGRVGQDAVFVDCRGTLTNGERVLVEHGDEEMVLSARRRWQLAMREACERDIEQLTGRRAIGLMSDNHIDPDLAVEAFALESSSEHARAAEATAAARRR